VAGSESARQAGVVLPAFSVRSATDWGVGELPDLGAVCAWLGRAGQRALHTLPLLERAGSERSPYSALSAFAIDPIHVALDAVEDFATAGGRAALPPGDVETIARLRADPSLDYDGIRAVKMRGLVRAFEQFVRTELAGRSARATTFDAFCTAEAGWLDDYVLYRALREASGETPWTRWDEAIRRRDPQALAAARGTHERACRFHAYVQWVAYEQLLAARRAARTADVEIVGDLPFTAAIDSADVWARQGEFDVTASIGAPPDAFNADGQDWALPAFRWDVVRDGGYRWLRARLGHAARWLDGVRMDHVVGYFRTWVRAPGRPVGFDPADEAGQIALGACALDVAREAAASTRIIVEDLGDIPPWVRSAMAARGLPGYRVLRWEGDWPAFREPREFPACSVATSGTHDTTALATWWTDELGDDGRRRLAEVPTFAVLRDAGAAFTPAVHEALVGGIYAAGSDVALLVIQDVFGGTERINTPATVGPHNWGYRMPLAVEELTGTRGRSIAEWLAGLAHRNRR
jgi:4-alpha-glucanotransferase